MPAYIAVSSSMRNFFRFFRIESLRKNLKKFCTVKKMSKSKEYIPVATSDTVYYEPQTQEEFDELMEVVKVGDMVHNKFVFEASGGDWLVTIT